MFPFYKQWELKHLYIFVITRTCLELGDVCKEIGLPSGVLNIVTGLGHEAGAPLSSHPDVDKVHIFVQYLFVIHLCRWSIFLTIHGLFVLLGCIYRELCNRSKDYGCCSSYSQGLSTCLYFLNLCSNVSPSICFSPPLDF